MGLQCEEIPTHACLCCVILIEVSYFKDVFEEIFFLPEGA